MMFGIVHGCSGWPDIVASGGGPERSIPNSRRLEIPSLTRPDPTPALRKLPPERFDGVRRSLDRNAALLHPAPDLNLELAGGQRAPADCDPHRASQQLGVGELLPRARVAVVVKDLEPRVLQLAV